jgi:hypothetical protein
MATRILPILGGVRPGTSGSVFWEPYSVKATNDVWQHDVLIFNDTAARDLCYGQFTVPQDYVGTPVFRVIWSSTATSGNAIWDLDYRTVGGDDTTSLDQAGVEEALTVTDAAPGATNRRMTPTMAAAANFAAGETVEFLFGRDGASADTIAAALIVFDLIFEYSDV